MLISRTLRFATFSFAALLAALIGLNATIALAGDDPSIKGKLRTDIHVAMDKHVEANSVNGKYVIYDAVKDEIKRLKFEKLHDGIVKKGDFYVSCADLRDADGTLYDLDFLVGTTGKNLTVLDAVVHKVGDDKRKYHVED